MHLVNGERCCGCVSRRQDIKVFLVGQETVVREELDKYTYPKEQIEVVGATRKIETAEPPGYGNPQEEGFIRLLLG